MLGNIWTKVIAVGAAIAAIAGLILRVFLEGKSAGRADVINETEREANQVERAAGAARRAGEKREREVKHEEKPADFDRYR